MTFSYVLRLLCLSFASFYLIHAALGLFLTVIMRPVLRIAERMEARHAARLLMAARLFPSVAAGLVVIALCVPSYIWLEPQSITEEMSVACRIAAILGLAVCAIALVRGGLALADSVRFLRACRQSAQLVQLPGESLPGWAIEGVTPPIMALAGAVRTHVVVSKELLPALSADQLDAAVRHERAHRTSRDNLKRLVLVAAPGLLPFINPWGALERRWARFAEWSADDAAVSGDPLRSLSLAEALVRVAGARSPARRSPLLASLVGDGDDLEVRVERLLHPAPRGRKLGSRIAWEAVATGVALCSAMAAVALRPACLSFVHDCLEHLIG